MIVYQLLIVLDPAAHVQHSKVLYLWFPDTDDTASSMFTGYLTLENRFTD